MGGACRGARTVAEPNNHELCPMSFAHTLDRVRYVFPDLKDLLAKASPPRAGDELAGVGAASASERVAAQMALAELPLRQFLAEAVVPYETDEVTRLIVDHHDAAAFAGVGSLTVGEFRDWLLGEAADTATLGALAPGLTPEMAAAVAKIMRLQDLIAVAAKCRTVTRFRNTIGLAGRLSTRLQPNHPTDDPAGIAASIVDGLMYGARRRRHRHQSGDRQRRHAWCDLLTMLDDDAAAAARYADPVLRAGPCDHDARRDRARRAGRSGVSIHRRHRSRQPGLWDDLGLLAEATGRGKRIPARNDRRNVMYFETGQGSELSSGGHQVSISRRWRRAAMASRDISRRCW